ncbi:hypothetical protein HPB50_004940 [Hyalomma asiaticum]|uniref:Uncharacterized protein n=1 Tax=Hyalomma asiaticum TaxID=266040 RepID=A0ACB7TD66_HYAAI|nr:hypothetical protein HPB50_004940 [Hyalomma asiaticum]
MPPLPREEIKIVIRPQGGLNILKIGAPTVTTAIFAPAKIAKEESTEDTVCPNPRQNIVVGTIQDSVPSTQKKMGKASRLESTPSDRLAAHGAPFEIEVTRQIQEPIPKQGMVSFQVYIPSTVRSYR